MRRRLLCLALSLALVPTAAVARADTGAQDATAQTVRANGVTATIGDSTISLANGVIERVWTKAPFGTQAITDKRTGLTTQPTSDFSLRFVDGVELTGKDFAVSTATAEPAKRGGLTLTMTLTHAVATVTRTITAYPGVAGFETRTSVQGPGALSGYTLDQIATPNAAPTLQAFSAGYDWRGSDTPDWEPQFAPFGGAHTGDHREQQTAGKGEALEGEGQWLSLAAEHQQATAFLTMERVNYASSRMAYDGSKGAAVVDLNRDVIYLGPFEADVHIGAPTRLPLRYKALNPTAPTQLENVFTGLALDADDEPWQYAKYLERRAPRWDKGGITFNSNGVDNNVISTGAKDDMNFAEVQRQAAVAKQLGVDTFILDDGWQAISGDWCPDSPECPEPRKGTDPKFEARFPDATFAAVREEIAPMKLGLWMSPMHFHPSAEAAKRNPGWICQPIGSATAAASIADPDSGSNDAGIGQWNPEGLGQDGKLIDYIEGRIRRAITEWEVSYFKFDFLAWLDCGGAAPVTAYEYRESFVRMLDRLIADHPTVTFQIDETNDYRLFPFESVARGPSWYANGGPDANEALHNLWLLSPYVPTSTIGQQTLAGERKERSTDYLMAVALTSHWTYFTDLTTFTPEQVATAAKWADLYHRERDRFTTMSYPLLDDPISGDNWTALQPWDPETQSGALLAFRQDSAEASRQIALRGVRGEGTYRVTEALTGALVGTFTADHLRAGLDVALPERYSAKVLLIDPA